MSPRDWAWIVFAATWLGFAIYVGINLWQLGDIP